MSKSHPAMAGRVQTEPRRRAEERTGREWMANPGYRAFVTFEEMYQLALSRKDEMPDGSSTTELFRKGPHGIGKKLVEEAAESWMAARYESDNDLSGELAQVLYYVAVMMAEKGISLEDVYRQL